MVCVCVCRLCMCTMNNFSMIHKLNTKHIAGASLGEDLNVMIKTLKTISIRNTIYNISRKKIFSPTF